MFRRMTPYEREWTDMLKKEEKFLGKRLDKKDTFINQKLEKYVPDKLQATLDEAFSKFFALVFEKGTVIIEKTYSKDKIKEAYAENDYNYLLNQNNKNFRKFSKKASNAGARNLLISGTAGIGMGIAGLGIPDIPVFTTMILRSIYEIALNYGYHYENEKEQNFILLIIQGAVSYSDELKRIDDELNLYIKTGKYSEQIDIKKQIKNTSASLSKELLYMKFLQGTPIVGAVGGWYDVVYMKQITEYANLKYKRRFLSKR